MVDSGRPTEAKTPVFNSALAYLEKLNTLSIQAHTAGMRQQYHLLMRTLDQYYLELKPRLVLNERREDLAHLKELREECARKARQASLYGPHFLRGFHEALYGFHDKLNICAHMQGLIMVDKASSLESLKEV